MYLCRVTQDWQKVIVNPHHDAYTAVKRIAYQVLQIVYNMCNVDDDPFPIYPAGKGKHLANHHLPTAHRIVAESKRPLGCNPWQTQTRLEPLAFFINQRHG